MDIDKIKEDFFEGCWVEERHEYLKELPVEHAKRLVESLTDEEVECNVNSRKFQEDYICDYLSELWGISKEAFWKHINISWHHKYGTVIGDNLEHVYVMRNEVIPEGVWKSILNSLTCESVEWESWDFWYEIIVNQTTKLKAKEDRQKQLLEWFCMLGRNEQELVSNRLRIIFDNNVPDRLISCLI